MADEVEEEEGEGGRGAGEPEEQRIALGGVGVVGLVRRGGGEGRLDQQGFALPAACRLRGRGHGRVPP